LPVPVDPPVTVIHGIADEAVHEQSALAETATCTEFGAGPSVTPLLESAVVHVAPVWETVKARRPMVSVPVRVDEVVFGATEYRTAPPPLPLPPEVTVIHPTLLVVDQRHPGAVETLTDESPPALPRVIEVGVRSVVHATPAWVTVTGSPEMVSVPTRDVLPVFAATL
jgi:hypothetical protein